MSIRCGIGYDLHRLAEGRKLIVGGIELPFEKGPVGHSDGDVLAHALCDALLGAAGLGDIGKLFPDTDERWRGADSRVLLREVTARVHAAGWRVENVDCTVIAQAPKIAPYTQAMRAAIAHDLAVDVAAISVKGKTTERLGFTGRGEGIAAQAAALLVRD